MSLHLGNLSARIQRDDLKRTFDRFGKNRLDIRDGYGFVIYDIPRNAENAIRKLQGKYICGERIPVTWSNKQPRYSQIFTKGSRFNEPYYRRSSRRGRGRGRGGSSAKEEPSHRERGFKLNREPDKEGGEPCVDDGEKEKGESVKDDCVDEGLPTETISADGRWGEPVSGWDRKEVENDVGRDIYEPYCGYEREDEDGSRYKAYSDVSSARGKSGEDSRKGCNVDATLKQGADSGFAPKCYDCGSVGHLSCYPPDGNASQKEKFARRGRERDRDVSFRSRSRRGLKRVRTESRGGSDFTRTPSPSRLKKRDGHLVGSKKHPRLVKDKISPSAKVSKHQRMKRQKKEDGKSLKEWKKSGRANLSPQRSGSIARSWLSTTSSGTSSSSRSISGSRSRSFSQRTHSASSSSRSTSMLPKLRSDDSRPKSKAVSPEALSLPVVQSQSLGSSPDKIDVEGIGTFSDNQLEEDNGPALKQSLIDQTQLKELLGDDLNAENSKVKITDGTLLEGIAVSLTKVDDERNMNCDRQLHEDGCHELDKIDYGIDSPSMNPSERVEGALDSSSESQEKRNDYQQPGPLEMEDVQFSHEKHNGEEPLGVEIKNSTDISSQEMYMVLKHYGLAMPNEKEENLSVENYFGSARMWPWEFIYYRRLKKGAITVENYARRIAQNEEFGIVDKYIRSSSGWGECEQSSL